MPVVIALLIRSAVQMAITLGLIEAAIALLDKAVRMIAKAFGATEEQATDIAANEFLKYAEALGIGVLALQAKLPTKVAERLGFTSKGYKPRAIKGSTKTPVQSVNITAKPTPAQTKATINEIAPVIAKQKRTTLETVRSVAEILIAAIGLPIGAGILLINTIDFAAWPTSAYQKTFQKIFSLFGLEIDQDYAEPRVMSKEMTEKIFAIYKQNGATSITDPDTGQKLPLNRENFISIADKIASKIMLESGKVTTRQMLGALTALVDIKEQQVPVTTAPAAAAAPAVGGISSIKVFTGLVSQGRLGATPSFMPRQDDLIETVEELQDAAQNNAAAFLAALPGKIIYELKITPSVTTRDGFKQVGAAQRVISGYTRDGTPKYRTVVNKFATLTFYAMSERGTKSKLATIVLGPTDAVKLQLEPQTLAEIEKSIQQNILAKDLNQINAVETTAPITIVQPPEVSAVTPMGEGAPPAPLPPPPPGFEYVSGPGLPRGFLTPVGEPIFTGSKSSGNILTQYFIYGGKGYSFTIDTEKEVKNAQDLAIVRQELKSRYPDQDIPESSVQGEILRRLIEKKWRETVEKEINPKIQQEKEPQTLWEWYASKGQTLPPVQERAKIYEAMGLGKASYYTGTAEQNIKLLTALKAAEIA